MPDHPALATSDPDRGVDVNSARPESRPDSTKFFVEDYERSAAFRWNGSSFGGIVFGFRQARRGARDGSRRELNARNGGSRN